MLYPIRRALAQTIYFPLVTAGSTGFQPTWTPAAAECRYIGDGAGITNLGSVCAHEDAGIWSQALTVAESSFGTTVLVYSDSETDVEDQSIICHTGFSAQLEANQGIIIGEVDDATFTPTTGAFEGFRLWPNVTEEATASHYNGRNLLFTSGALLGQMTTVTSYALANSKEKFSFTATLTEIAADGDRYVVL